jgi:hypothetical protein
MLYGLSKLGRRHCGPLSLVLCAHACPAPHHHGSPHTQGLRSTTTTSNTRLAGDGPHTKSLHNNACYRLQVDLCSHCLTCCCCCLRARREDTCAARRTPATSWATRPGAAASAAAALLCASRRRCSACSRKWRRRRCHAVAASRCRLSRSSCLVYLATNTWTRQQLLLTCGCG